MSRTYRCTSIKPDSWVFYYYTKLEDDSWGYVKYSDKEIKRRLARYHSDAAKYRRYLGSAPHSYCNVFERKMRMEAKTELHKFKMDSNYEVMIRKTHRRSATYDWW
jgi:hypothetical protein